MIDIILPNAPKPQKAWVKPGWNLGEALEKDGKIVLVGAVIAGRYRIPAADGVSGTGPALYPLHRYYGGSLQAPGPYAYRRL